MTSSLFISHLPLSQATPRIEPGLYRFLEQKVGVDRLVLLGVIFLALLGVDADSPYVLRFTSALQRMAGRGTRTYLIRGNTASLGGRALPD